MVSPLTFRGLALASYFFLQNYLAQCPKAFPGQMENFPENGGINGPDICGSYILTSCRLFSINDSVASLVMIFSKTTNTVMFSKIYNYIFELYSIMLKIKLN